MAHAIMQAQIPHSKHFTIPVQMVVHDFLISWNKESVTSSKIIQNKNSFVNFTFFRFYTFEIKQNTVETKKKYI